MLSLFTYNSPPSQCGYLPDEVWSLQYEMVASMSAAEYEARMARGWRRFGNMLFTPACPECTQCKPLRVIVDRFKPSRSQKRAWKRNQGEVSLAIGEPEVTEEKLRLYDRYHAFQADAKDWPFHGEKDAEEYAHSFVRNPFPTEEWLFRVGEKLIGVGYVDVLPRSLSAIYFFYEPEERGRSLGTFNVLSVLAEAARRALPHVYLGFYVRGCGSMEYKEKYRPNEILGEDGVWRVKEGEKGRKGEGEKGR